MGVSGTAALRGQDQPVYKNPQAPLEQRVDALLQAMTPDEKLSLLSAIGFRTRPIPRLGIPSLEMSDAGQGVRGGSRETHGPATLFTSGVLLAATWDPDLASRIGHAIGEEAQNKGIGTQIEFGPGLNILRTPLGGRSGEYMGEDPYLTSRMGVSYVEGMQETGVSACVKHYDANNQEFRRDDIDELIGERALREIYTPAFLAAVKEAKVWTIMCAYNRVNGVYCSANWYLQQQILKNEAGFDGLMLTDWNAAHSPLVLNDGCDLETPGGRELTADRVARVLASGEVSQSRVDDAVKRILRTIIRTGLMNPRQTPDPNQLNTPAHQALAEEAAQEGIVLLKNEQNALPLDPAKIHSLALIGPACKTWQMGVGGSGEVKPFQSVSAYDGIVARAGSAIKIDYDYGYDEGYAGKPVPASVLRPASGEGKGLTAQYFSGGDFSQAAAATRIEPGVDLDVNQNRLPDGVDPGHFAVRWTGSLIAPVTGTYRMNLVVPNDGSGGRLYIDDKLVRDLWFGSDPTHLKGTADLTAGKSYSVRIEFTTPNPGNRFQWMWLRPDEDLFAGLRKTAAQADAAIVFVGSGGEAEGSDKRSYDLPGVQNEMIRAVAAANPHTIVVLNNGAPVGVSDWINQVPGALDAFFPAQSGGTALAKILFGDVNPSGKLPYTIARRREDYPDFGHYPMEQPGTAIAKQHDHPVVAYTEGIYVGYRAFDKRKITPSFPFGHGLSYTTFQYGNMNVSEPAMKPGDPLTVTADITNTGARAGTEVVQLYARADVPKIDRPVRELKGLARVELQPGETKPVTFHLTARDFAYCDVPGKQWKADAGAYTIELGSSSRDLRAKAAISLSTDYTEALPGLGAKSPFVTAPSLTTGKKATASSVQGDFTPNLAVDNDENTRWSSGASDPQWLEVDLGRPTRFDHAEILWEAAYATSYQLQTSADGQSWTTIYANDQGRGGSDRFSFDPVTARWVRILGTKRGTQFGYSIYEFNLSARKK